MAGGEERNGLELWRKLHETNEGGAEQCAIAGLGRLHRLEKCPSLETLGFYLGDWEMLRNKYGQDIPDASLYTMLMGILPKEVQK